MSLRDRISEALHLDPDGEPFPDPDSREIVGDTRVFLRGWDAAVAEMQRRARDVLAGPEPAGRVWRQVTWASTYTRAGARQWAWWDGTAWRTEDGAVILPESVRFVSEPDSPETAASFDPTRRQHWCPTADGIAAKLHAVSEREATLAVAARNLLATLEASASTSRLREAIKASTEGGDGRG